MVAWLKKLWQATLQLLGSLGTFLRKHWQSVFVAGIAVIAIIVWAEYARRANLVWADWTGLGPYKDANGKLQRGKTLWDWLGLLIVPVVLGVGALFFNRQERQNELKIAEERRISDLEIADNRNQETVLQNYLDKMSELILERQLMEVKHILDEVYEEESSWPINEENTKEPDFILSDAQRAVWDMAQIRTVTILRQLNNYRRNIVLQFLRDADLASFLLRFASLEGADLQGTSFSGINLIGADLSETNLRGASLRGAILRGADLRGANLRGAFLAGANLHGTNLIGADLAGAILRGAELIGTNLEEANLEGADLLGVTLRGVNITHEQLASVKKIRLSQ